MNIHRTQRLVYLTGALITLLLISITALSPKFQYGSDMLARPIIPFVILMTLAGALYLLAVSLVRGLFPSNNTLLTIAAVGLIMRAALFFSDPILEDDFYRYLWDGAVTANGHNPYAHTPDESFYNPTHTTPESDTVFDRINHRKLGTVYPPVAQAAFAAAHLIEPWSLNAWKGILLLADTATAILLLIILRKAGLPETRILIYWWNPLLIKEIYNSAHMDPLIMLFIAIALLCAIHQYTLRTALALTLAIATKLWPIILAPLFLRYSRALKPERFNVTLIATALLTLLSIPMLWAISLGQKSGFLAYSERWEMNDALFMIFDKLTHLIATPLNIPEPNIDTLTRITVAATLLLWIAYLAKNRQPDAPDFFNRLTLATAALFMLSPTQFPWYYLWILPLLTLAPRPSLLILTPMLPLYYLKFHYAAHDQINTFHNTIVWIEYTPTLILLTHEAITKKLDLTPATNPLTHQNE